MMAERRVRRSWDISKRTADSLNKLQLISGVEKSDLVDISITFLFQTVLAVRACTGRSSHEIIESIAKALPADIRNSDMQVESGPLKIDLTQLLKLVGDSSMIFDSSIFDDTDRQQTTLTENTPDADGSGGDDP